MEKEKLQNCITDLDTALKWLRHDGITKDCINGVLAELRTELASKEASQ